MALLDFGWNLMGYSPMNGYSEVLSSVKNMFNSGADHKQGDLKSIAILFAFQVIVPGAIKLISYTANSVDGYLDNAHANNASAPSLIIPNATPDIATTIPTGPAINDIALVVSTQQLESVE